MQTSPWSSSWSSFQNDDHCHHLMTMVVMAFGMIIIFKKTTMVIMFLNYFMILYVWRRPCAKSGWWPWSSFSGWWPWLQCLNDHGKIEDDIISWWPQQMMTRMMTIVKKCANLKKKRGQNEKLETKPVTRPSGNPTTAHSTAVSRFYNAKKKRSLWLCLPEYLKG